MLINTPLSYVPGCDIQVGYSPTILRSSHAGRFNWTVLHSEYILLPRERMDSFTTLYRLGYSMVLRTAGYPSVIVVSEWPSLPTVADLVDPAHHRVSTYVTRTWENLLALGRIEALHSTRLC